VKRSCASAIRRRYYGGAAIFIALLPWEEQKAIDLVASADLMFLLAMGE
jgi:hypothetical protein